MTSDIELAAQRIRQLVDLTKALTARLADETRAFEAQRPQDAAASLQKTQELANLYRRDSAHVKANPALIASAPAATTAGPLAPVPAPPSATGEPARTDEPGGSGFRARLARLGSRVGYRPSADQLGIVRPAVAYGRLRDFANAALSLLSADSQP